LAAFRDLFVKFNCDEIQSAEVVRQLNADPESEWREYKDGRPISQWQFAAAVAKYKNYPTVIHPTKRADKSPRGYRLADCADAFARFLPPQDSHIRTSKPK